MGTPGSLPIRLTAVPDRWVRPTPPTYQWAYPTYQ
jgi:hypothetical protein